MLENLKNVKFNFLKDTNYLFVGCGSSYNLGFITKTLLNLNGYKATAKQMFLKGLNHPAEYKRK